MNYFEYLGIKIYLSSHNIGHWMFFHGNEFWKDIPGYKRKYKVSTKGRVINVSRNRILSPFDRKKGRKDEGYMTVHLGSLHLGKRFINYTVHSLVMLCFKGERTDEKPIIHHKDFNKSNNSMQNLEYCDQSYNRKQDFLAGNSSFLGEKNNMSKLTSDQVIQIFSMKGRVSYSEIGKQYGLSVSGISSIMNGYTWSEITGMKNLRNNI